MDALLEDCTHFGTLPRRGNTLSDTTGAHIPIGANMYFGAWAPALMKIIFNKFSRVFSARPNLSLEKTRAEKRREEGRRKKKRKREGIRK